jgi:hypothetical protein
VVRCWLIDWLQIIIRHGSRHCDGVETSTGHWRQISGLSGVGRCCCLLGALDEWNPAFRGVAGTVGASCFSAGFTNAARWPGSAARWMDLLQTGDGFVVQVQG